MKLDERYDMIMSTLTGDGVEAVWWEIVSILDTVEESGLLEKSTLE